MRAVKLKESLIKTDFSFALVFGYAEGRYCNRATAPGGNDRNE